MGEPAGGGSTTLQCQRTTTRFKHGGGKPEWGSPQNACILWGPRVGGGNQDNLETDSLFEVSPNTMRTLIKCLGSHTNAFLLSAKGSENAQGEFSERGPHRKKFRWGIFPPGNPKTPHTPTNGKRARGGTVAPLSKGGKGKRQQEDKSDMEKEHIKKEVETINRVCFFAIKARDGRPLRACFDFNLTSLSRERKF